MAGHKEGRTSKKARQQSHHTMTGKYKRYRDGHRREKNKRRRAAKLEKKYKKNRDRRLRRQGVNNEQDT